jgi:glycosyltransferase involved in cell wall biosynthesis
MKVLHVIKGLGLAGAERHLIALLAGLRKKGIDARLLLWVSPERQGDDVMAAAEQNGIPVERWTMPTDIAPHFFWKLYRYLKQNPPDIVHTHLFHAETYAIPAAKFAGVRYVVNSSHNDDPFRRSLSFRIRSRILWRLTVRGIAISESVKRFLLDYEGARKSQLRVIYYGLEPESISPIPQPTLQESLGLSSDARIIGSVCRLVEQKGITYAIRAMHRLAPDYPNLHYVIVGDGVLREQLSQQVADAVLSDRIHFLGWREDIASLMVQFEIFIAPSLWEGFGLVFLEAMKQARPIVSTKLSSVPEVIAQGKTGVLVEPRDPDALAIAIRHLLDEPDMARRMGEAGRRRLETVFSQQTMIEQTAKLYRELFGKWT